MIKKIILWLLVLILFCLGVVSYVGYRAFNTEAFKEQIVQSIQEATGRTFTVNGNYQLAWDPLPTMTLEDVVLSNTPSSPNQEMFKADKVQIQIEWASLFTTPSRIKSVIIVKPVVLIERLSRATNNLQFPLLMAPQNKLETESAFDEVVAQTQIDTIQIEDGEIHYINHVNKNSQTLSKVTGSITMGALSGPFSFEGTAAYGAVPLKVKASLGVHEMSQPVNFMADLSASSSKTHLTIDAQFHPENAEVILLGSVSFESEKPNTLLEALKKPLLPKKYDTTTVSSMKIELGTAKAGISDFILKIGNDDRAFTVNAKYTEGTAVQPGQLTINTSALDLDVWEDTLKNIFDQMQFSGYPINFSTSTPQITWHGKSSNAVKISGSTEQNTLYISEIYALLPGSTTAQVSGRLFKTEDNLGVILNVDLQSQNFGPTLAFFNPPQNRFTQLLQKVQKTEFKAALEWTPEGVNLEIPALSVNDATGVARFSKQPNQITEVVLELDNVDLNTYFPVTNTQNQTIQEATNAVFSKLQTVKMPTESAHTEFIFKNAKWLKTIFQSMTLITDFDKSNTNLEAVIETADQDSLVLKTEILNLGTPDWSLPQNTFEFSGKDLSVVLKNLNITTDSKLIQNARQFNIIGQITGDPKRWQIDTTAKTSALTIDVMGTLLDGKPQQVNARFQHKSIPHLFVELFDKNPLQNLGGELTIETTLDQQNDIINLSDLTIKAGTEYTEGTATYAVQTQSWNFNLASNTLDLQKVLPDMGHFYLNATGFDSHPFDFVLLSNIKGSLDLKVKELFYQTTHLRNALLQAHVSDNTLFVDNLITSGDGETPSTVQAKGSISWIKTPSFNVKLVTQALPITTPFAMFEGVGLTGGLLTSEWNLAASGDTPLQMVRSLKGNGQITLDNSTWIGADLSALINTLNKTPKEEDSKEVLISRCKHALSNGSTPVQNIQGSFTIADGLWQIAAATIETSVADSQSATLDWDIPTTTVQAKAPLVLKEYTTLPSIVLKLLKNEKGVSYSVDTTEFINAIFEGIEQEKKRKQEAAEQAQREAAEQERQEMKQQAFATYQTLLDQVAFWSEQLISTPDVLTQKEVMNAQVFLEQLEPIIQTPELGTEQYRTIDSQIKKVLADLDKAQSSFTREQKGLFQEQGKVLLKQSQDRISQINELYQKRPTLTSLANIIQEAEEQKAIIQRALDQYKKPINFMQIKQVSNIIKEAHKKIETSYDYAEGIYSGRQTVPANTTIRRLEP